jgi:aminopeptidase N
MRKILLATYFLLLANCINAQLTTPKQTFTKADTLRGSNNENRDWWDVLHYDITVKPDFEKKEIEGICQIAYKIDKEKFKSRIKRELNFQIDLQEGLVIDSVIAEILPSCMSRNIDGSKANIPKYFKKIEFKKTDGIYLINFLNATDENIYPLPIKIHYHGKPQEAKKAPWDGGWVWAKDKLGRPFVSVACQGLGASCWFPCKDIQSDKPDYGASLTIVVPDSLVGIGNGKTKDMEYKKYLSLDSAFNQIFTKPITEIAQEKQLKVETIKNYPTKPQGYKWWVRNPINTYCIIPYIGNYVNFTDTFVGEKGTLDLNYWVLDYNKEKAQEQFKQVKPMLRAFEYWFGAYPFYEDGYKLVEAPYLGMEHQSAIAYGNGFQNGYRGRDLSGSGWGLKWDFIIVHESGHEWFANSITTNDIADMWVHEGFTNYSEVLFTEYYYGKEAGNDYCYGLRKNIANDVPIIGPYGVNKEGSGDMYYKAANMIHSIRNALNDDEKFRKILRGMNSTFYHKTIDGKDIQQYLIEQTGLDLQKTFDQYLTTTQIPKLEYYFKGKKLFYRYSNCIDGFNMQITIPSTNKRIIPSTSWQHKRLNKKNKEWFTIKNVERLYLLKVENAEPLSSPSL